MALNTSARIAQAPRRTPTTATTATPPTPVTAPTTATPDKANAAATATTTATTTAATTATTTAPTRTPRRLLLLVALAPALANADAGIVSLALPEIRGELSMTLTGVHWVTNIYVLLVGSLQLLGGRLADLAGARRLFLRCLAGIALASAACGAAPTGELLVAARALQALTAAVLVPAAMSLLLAATPERAGRARALALWAATGGLGSVAGVLLGGLVVSGFDWRWAFYLNVPLVAAALLAARRLALPDPRPLPGTRLDMLGAITLTGALLAFVYALVRYSEHGGDRTVLHSAALALALGALFVRRQRRGRDPLLPKAVLTRLPLAMGAVGILAVSAATAPVIFLGSAHLQQTHHYSPALAGCALLPMVGGIILVGRGCSRALAERGPWLPCAVGAGLVAVGLLLLSGLTPASSYAAGVLPGIALTGAGLPLVWMSCEMVALTPFTGRHAGVAAGVVQSAGQLGAALGLALAVAVVNSRSGHGGSGEGLGVAFGVSAVLVGPALVMGVWGVWGVRGRRA